MIRYEAAIKKRIANLKDRKLLLCGDDAFTDYIAKDFMTMGKDIKCRGGIKGGVFCIQDGNSHEMKLEDVNPQNYFVLVAVFERHKEYVDCLEKMGFTYGNDYEVMGIGGYCTPITHISPLLTYCRNPEYAHMGNGKYTILIYGGSTSDVGRGGIKGWPEYFQEELNLQGGGYFEVYNGAVSGYGAAQEFLKLCRDITVLHPNLVISFSGVNDIGGGVRAGNYPFLHKYQKKMWEQILEKGNCIPDSMDMRNMHEISWGIERNDNPGDAAIWLDYERMMYAVCMEFQAFFLGIVEPMSYSHVLDKTLEQDLVELLQAKGIDKAYFKNQKKFVMEVHDHICQKHLDYMIDLSEYLSGETGAFSDYIHYTEKGNQLIGNYMAGLVIKKIKENGNIIK